MHTNNQHHSALGKTAKSNPGLSDRLDSVDQVTEVPFIDVHRYKDLLRPVLKDWEQIFESGRFIGGQLSTDLEVEINLQLETQHALACSNGSDALIAAMLGYGIGPGDRVAVPNTTFWATVEAVCVPGGTPVLIDTDPVDLQMSFEHFQESFERFRFRAAILPHLYGWCSRDIWAYRAFCQKNGIHLVEDAAQAFGVRIPSSHPGPSEGLLASAECGTLSFYPAKVIGAAGDGGALTTRSADTMAPMRSVARHGRVKHYSYERIGINCRMDSLQAAYLLQVLKHSGTMLESRRQALNMYSEQLKDLRESHGVQMHLPPPGVTGNGYLCMLTVAGKSGQDLSAALKLRGVQTANTYPETLSQQTCLSGKALFTGTLQHSLSMASAVLNLPLFAGIRADEVSYSVEQLRNVLNQTS